MGAQPDPRPWNGQSKGRSQQLVRPAARTARGHGLQALTTRTRGACPLTGRDKNVGRTNQIERSLKEVSGLKASRSSAQSVSQSGPCAAARATISHPVQNVCAPPHEAGRRRLELNTGFQVTVWIQPGTGLCTAQANARATAFHDDRREKDHWV